MDWVNYLLDILFFWLHIIVILFNLFGWVWYRMRKWHLIVAGATMFSWLILGLRYGFGYCFLTDWHWEIKYKLGSTSLPNSFIQYFIEEYMGLSPNDSMVDWLTGFSFTLAVLASLYVNFFRKKV